MLFVLYSMYNTRKSGDTEHLKKRKYQQFSVENNKTLIIRYSKSVVINTWRKCKCNEHLKASFYVHEIHGQPTKFSSKKHLCAILLRLVSTKQSNDFSFWYVQHSTVFDFTETLLPLIFGLTGKMFHLQTAFST